MATELGRIAGLTAEVREPRALLQLTVHELTRWMVWLALGFSSLVPLLGRLRGGQPLRLMLLTGLSMAFATIPEELPIIITKGAPGLCLRRPGRQPSCVGQAIVSK